MAFSSQHVYIWFPQITDKVTGGAILAHIWAKNAFHHFVLIGLLEQYTKFKSKTFKLTFIFAMVTKNGHQNGLKNGKANILEQI